MLSATERPDRQQPAPAWWRWARATVTAGVALSLGSVAHTTAGGLLPSAPAMLVLAAVSVVGCWLLLAAPASAGRLVGLVVAVQTAGHGVLTVLAGHTGAVAAAPSPASAPVPRADWSTALVASDSARRTGSLRDLAAVDLPHAGSTPDASPLLPQLLDELTGPHAAMALAHLVAAGLLGAWLAVGERALATLVHLAGDHARAATEATVVALRESSRWGAAVSARATRVGPERRAHAERTAYDGVPGLLAEVCRAVSRRGPPSVAASH